MSAIPGSLSLRALAERVLRIEEPGEKLTYRHVDETVAAWEKRAAELRMSPERYGRGRLEAVRELRDIEEDGAHPEFAHQLALHDRERPLRGSGQHPEDLRQVPPDAEATIPTPEEDLCEPY